MEFVREKSVNLFFRYKAFIAAQHQSTELFLLGRKVSECEEDLQRVLKNLAWFTYTRGFTPIKLEDGGLIHSDTGWGCMIRCGQMLVYGALVRAKGTEPSQRVQLLEDFFCETKEKLGVFALQSLVVAAREKLGKKPGEWFRATTLALALESCLHKSNLDAGFELLNVLENIFYWEELSTRAFLTPEISDSTESCLANLRNRDWNRKVLVVIHTMLGVDGLDARYEPFLQAMCKLGSFVGFLGGEKDRAYYFYGIDSQRYLYLDPHFCRRAWEVSKTEDAERIFFGQKPVFKLSASQLSSSVAIWLLFESRQQFTEFYETYCALSKKMGEDFFFCDALRKADEEFGEMEIVEF